MTALAMDLVGWVGAGAVLLAYALVSAGRLAGPSAANQWLNLGGGLLLLGNTAYHRAFPSAGLNLVWAGIAVAALLRAGRTPPAAGPRFGHVNLIARDWRPLARFYQDVFGCMPVPPERDYAGPELAAGTGLPGARLRGVHLRLPGFGPDGPTLEIYQYDAPADPVRPEVNRPGWGHAAFGVADVAAARAGVLAAGGATVGEVVESVTAAGQRVTWCYCRDPEGNVVELQRWA